MTRRYYVPDLPEAGGSVHLPVTEAQHAIRVMRVKIGDKVELFNGRGQQSEAMISQLERNRCVCQSAPAQPIDREPSRIIRMAIALPKPDRSKELIERLTELGIQHVTPLVAERTQRAPTNSTLEKLRKQVIEACKQSGRNQLLEIGPVTNAIDYFGNESAKTKVVAHPTSNGISPIELLDHGQDRVFAIAVGPEGGWTENEHRVAVECGFLSVNLGTRIYRIETASVALAAILVSEAAR